MAAPGVASRVDIINDAGERVTLTLVRPGGEEVGQGVGVCAQDSSVSVGSVYGMAQVGTLNVFMRVFHSSIRKYESEYQG